MSSPPTNTCQILWFRRKSLSVISDNSPCDSIGGGGILLPVRWKTFNFYLLETNIEFLVVRHCSWCRGYSKERIDEVHGRIIKIRSKIGVAILGGVFWEERCRPENERRECVREIVRVRVSATRALIWEGDGLATKTSMVSARGEVEGHDGRTSQGKSIQDLQVPGGLKTPLECPLSESHGQW